MTYEYSKIFDTTVGIDIDENAVAFAKKNYDTEKIEFICTPIEELEQENNFYDVITCSHIYEHVPDANKLMSEIYRLLKPATSDIYSTWVKLHYGLNLQPVLKIKKIKIS